MKHSHSITDKTWVSILAGKQEADNSDEEQRHLKKIRELLLEQQPTLSQDELKEEKERLFKRMEKEGLFEPEKESFFRRLFGSSTKNKYIIPSLILVSLAIVVVSPLLTINKDKTTQYKTELPVGMVYKNIESTSEQIIYANDPAEKSEELAKIFENSEAFENITIKEKESGLFIIEATINLNLADRALEILALCES